MFEGQGIKIILIINPYFICSQDNHDKDQIKVVFGDCQTALNEANIQNGKN